MAIVIDGKIVSDKERKKLAKEKAKPKKEKTNVGKDVWFLDGLELYEGVILEELPNEFYKVEAVNKNIHKNGELQLCIIPMRSVRFT